MPIIPKRGTKRTRQKPKPQGRRRNSNQQFYNSTAWRRLAKQVERESKGLCEECKRNGRITDATGRKGVTDHIIRVNDRWDLRLQRNNLQRLCNSCHNKKSGREAHNTTNEK